MTEAIPPSAYRLRHHSGAVDEPQVDRKTSRRTWRLVSPVENLYRTGRLSESQWLAFKMFERDCDRASRIRGVTAAYSERIGSSLAEIADDLLCPVTRRMDAYRRVIDKLEWIGERSACRVLVEATMRETSFQILAKDVLGMSRNKGTGYAEALLQQATYRLAEYDGHGHSKSCRTRCS